MGLEFTVHWLVIAAAALAVGAVALAVRLRRAPPALFMLASAAFLFAGARPALKSDPGVVTHAVIQDVSDSMAVRVSSALNDEIEQAQIPSGHAIANLELSDALRQADSPKGGATDYGALAAISSDDRFNGEVILATDGRGSLAALTNAVDPARLILLRVPAAPGPDASVIGFAGPTSLVEGGTALLRATLHCDRDADVRWRITEGELEIASGTRKLAGGRPAGISASYVPSRAGLVRVRLSVEVEGDREPRNDDAWISFHAGTRRVVRYCVPSSHDAGSDGLIDWLRGDERTELQITHQLPRSHAELEGIGLLVINNLSLQEGGGPAADLQAIADWVMAGGNLLMLGAEGAFGPGGYRNTPLETVMPVRFRPDDAPPDRTLLLLDASSSMAEIAGGTSKLDMLREAARRVLAAADQSDVIALAGFNTGVTNDVVFRAATDPAQERTLAGLAAAGSTNIHDALEQGLSALGSGETEARRRIILITDGEDVSGREAGDWNAMGQALAQSGARLDIVLTQRGAPPWVAGIQSVAGADVHDWTVGTRGFEGLLETLDRALASGAEAWISQDTWEVPGVMLPLTLLSRTAERGGADVFTVLTANPRGTPRPSYPVLAWRQLVGRSACISTRSWGDDRLREFWGAEGFRVRLNDMLDFVTATVGRTNLVLNPLEQGAELLWVGASQPPARDLMIGGGGTARLDKPGRWLLPEMPAGDELLVLDGKVMLQRVPLPRIVPYELRLTGDDEAFFSMAEQAGIRVVNSLSAWQPARFLNQPAKPTDLTWAPALLALVLLVSGYALRKRQPRPDSAGHSPAP